MGLLLEKLGGESPWISYGVPDGTLGLVLGWLFFTDIAYLTARCGLGIEMVFATDMAYLTARLGFCFGIDRCS